MTTDALDELRANLIDGIATAQSRSRAVRRRALAAAVTVGVSLAALLMAWVESGDNAALAITRDAHWLTVRLADENATPEEIERELRVAGIDADVRLVPARADAVGKWLFVEVEPPSVQAPTLEDRAEVQRVQLVNHDVRIRADFDGKVYLTAGRVAKRDEYCGPGGTVDDLSPTSEPEPPPEPCVPQPGSFMTQRRPRWSEPLDCPPEHGFFGLTVDVVADGEGLAQHAGVALLVEAADRLGFTDALSRPLAPMRERRGRHDPGRVVRDLAVMLADGGECLADLCGVQISSRCSGRSRGQGRHGASSACVSAVGGWVARDGGDCWHQARLSRKSVATPSAKSARRHRPF